MHDLDVLQGRSMSRLWRIVQKGATLQRRAQVVVAALALVALTTARDVERYGDNYQIALPILALGCEAINGQALNYLGRYAIMFVGLHGTKRGLGDAPIAHRPRGGLEGFPSGHTATATFGAAKLAQSCLKGAPVVQTAVILAAAYTGASRIEAGAHDIWQVMAGAIWGIICAIGFMPGSASRGFIANLRDQILGKRKPQYDWKR
jgi:membrane-associated phospholipid phosphatase